MVRKKARSDWKNTNCNVGYILVLFVICTIFVPLMATICFGISFRFNYDLGYHPVWKVPAFDSEAKYKVIDESKLIYEINGATLTGGKPYVIVQIDYELLFRGIFLLTICFLCVIGIYKLSAKATGCLLRR